MNYNNYSDIGNCSLQYVSTYFCFPQQKCCCHLMKKKNYTQKDADYHIFFAKEKKYNARSSKRP